MNLAISSDHHPIAAIATSIAVNFFIGVSLFIIKLVREPSISSSLFSLWLDPSITLSIYSTFQYHKYAAANNLINT